MWADAVARGQGKGDHLWVLVLMGVSKEEGVLTGEEPRSSVSLPSLLRLCAGVLGAIMC